MVLYSIEFFKVLYLAIFMSKLTFLTREYLLRYKASFVIKFVWFVFDKILQSLVSSYFYVKIDFPDQKILTYVSMFYQDLFKTWYIT